MNEQEYLNKLLELYDDIITMFFYNDKYQEYKEELLSLVNQANQVDISGGEVPPQSEMEDKASDSALDKISDTMDKITDSIDKANEVLDKIQNPGKILDQINDKIQRVLTASNQIKEKATEALKKRFPNIEKLPREKEREKVKESDDKKDNEYLSARQNIESASTSSGGSLGAGVAGAASKLKELTSMAQQFMGQASQASQEAANEMSNEISGVLGRILQLYNLANIEIETYFKPIIDQYREIIKILTDLGITIPVDLDTYLSNEQYIIPDELKVDLEKMGFSQEVLDYVLGIDKKIEEATEPAKEQSSNMKNMITSAIGQVFSALNKKPEKFNEEAKGYGDSLDDSKAKERTDKREYKENQYVNVGANTETPESEGKKDGQTG